MFSVVMKLIQLLTVSSAGTNLICNKRDLYSQLEKNSS